MRIVNTSPTPEITASDTGPRSIPEPSISRWRRGSASTAKMTLAGASIRRETLTGWYSSVAIALLHALRPGAARPTSCSVDARRAGFSSRRRHVLPRDRAGSVHLVADGCLVPAAGERDTG